MREDLPDMNPGKAMAQAAHAQSDFDEFVNHQCGMEYKKNYELWNSVRSWKDDRSFGTTLVLSATKAAMQVISMNVLHHGMTIDPTYPWKNWYGKTFTSVEVTCMWAFTVEAEEISYMQLYPLHQ